MSATSSVSHPTSPPPEAFPAERRAHERKPLHAHVELRTRKDAYVLAVANISAGGMLLHRNAGDIELAKDDEVRMFLDLADNAMPMCVTLTARVVRVTPTSIALQWIENAAGTIAQLSQLVASLPL